MQIKRKERPQITLWVGNIVLNDSISPRMMGTGKMWSWARRPGRVRTGVTGQQ